MGSSASLLALPCRCCGPLALVMVSAVTDGLVIRPAVGCRSSSSLYRACNPQDQYSIDCLPV